MQVNNNENNPLIDRIKKERFEPDKLKNMIEAASLDELNSKDADGNTILHLVLQSDMKERKKEKMVNLLIKKGAEIDEKNNAGLTPLQVSLSNCHFRVALKLIRKGANPNVVDNAGSPALICLIRNVDAKIMKNFLDKLFFSEDGYDNRNENCEKSVDSYINDIRALDDEERADFQNEMILMMNLNAVDKMGKTALHYLAEMGRYHLFNFFKLFVALSVDINKQDSSGMTLLHFAVLEQAEGKCTGDYVEYLISRGAKMMPNNEGKYPVDLISDKNQYLKRLFVVDCLNSIDRLTEERSGEKRVDSFSTLPGDVLRVVAEKLKLEDQLSLGSACKKTLHAVLKNQHSKANFLFRKNIESILREASAWSNIPLMQLCLNAGADVNSRDRKGMMPIHCAARNGATEAVEFLIDHGAMVNSTTYSRSTPLHYGAESCRVEVVQHLITKGANLNPHARWGDNKKTTPLDVASPRYGNPFPFYDVRQFLSGVIKSAHELAKSIESGNLLLVEEHLMNQGLINNIYDKLTPLHRAIKNQDLNMAKLLVQQGAQVEGLDESGKTPIHRAAKLGNRGLFQFLLDNGAKISARDPKGRTALKFAMDAGFVDIANSIFKIYIDEFKKIKDEALRDALIAKFKDTVSKSNYLLPDKKIVMDFVAELNQNKSELNSLAKFKAVFSLLMNDRYRELSLFIPLGSQAVLKRSKSLPNLHSNRSQFFMPDTALDKEEGQLRKEGDSSRDVPKV